MKHQQYTNAVDSRNGKVMSVKEITAAPDFYELRYNLECPTVGCSARLKFVNGKTGNYLRAYPHTIHDKNCPFANAKKTRGTRSRGTVLATLTQDQVTSRIASLLKEAFPRKNKKNSTVVKKSRPRKTIRSKNISSTTVAVKYSSSAAPLSTKSKHTPHVPHLQPNQIGIGSEGSVFKGFGFVKSFKKKFNNKMKKPHYKLLIQSPGSNLKLTLLIRDSYFRRLPPKTLDGGMTDFAMNYSQKYPLLLGFIATVVDGENRIGEIKTDYDVKVLSNRFNSNGKAYTFAEFYSIISHQ